jgi:hypothetical protein
MLKRNELGESGVNAMRRFALFKLLTLISPPFVAAMRSA